MPRLSFSRPKYRRHSLRNIAFVVHQGRRVYLPGKFNSAESRREYLRLLAEWETAGRRQRRGPATSV